MKFKFRCIFPRIPHPSIYISAYIERDVRSVINVKDLGQFQIFVKAGPRPSRAMNSWTEWLPICRQGASSWFGDMAYTQAKPATSGNSARGITVWRRKTGNKTIRFGQRAVKKLHLTT